FHDDPAPMTVFLAGKTGGPQLLNDRGKEVRRGGQVVKVIASGGKFLVHLGQHLAKLPISLGLPKIATQVVEASFEPGPELRLDGTRRVLSYFLGDLAAEIFPGQLGPSHADYRELLRQ